MSAKLIVSTGLLAAGALTAFLILAASASTAPAHAQLNPVPPECTCSRGTNLGDDANPVVIRHCQCGILSCAVVVSSGQLQCVR